MNKNIMKGLVSAGVLMLFASPSFAAIDVTTATDLLASGGDVDTAISDIGTAMLGLAAVAVGFKWAKASIFG